MTAYSAGFIAKKLCKEVEYEVLDAYAPSASNDRWTPQDNFCQAG
jgi:hypothetical protein